MSIATPNPQHESRSMVADSIDTELIIVESSGMPPPRPSSPEILEFRRRRLEREAELQKLHEEHRRELERLKPADTRNLDNSPQTKPME
jgi:hypothetical protein